MIGWAMCEEVIFIVFFGARMILWLLWVKKGFSVGMEIRRFIEICIDFKQEVKLLNTCILQCYGGVQAFFFMRRPSQNIKKKL